MKTIILVAFFTRCYVVCMDLVNKYMNSINFESINSSNEVTTSNNVYSISISGEVVNPGLYTVARNSNLGYLISLAGGLKENADITCFNSMAILDENLKNYYIPSISVDENHKSTKVALNSATQATLDAKLPGVGEVFSKRIIDYRNSNGGFKTIDELRNVKGIGNSLFESIKDLVCL